MKKMTQLSLLILSMLTLGGIARSQLLLANSSDQSANSLDQLISHDIDESLRLNAEGKDLRDWELSQYTPRDIFRYVHDLQDPNAWSALCDKLLTLSPRDLALFGDEATREKYQDALTCRRQIEATLENYWKEAGVDLADAAESQRTTNPPIIGDARGFNFLSAPNQLPSIEKIVDTSTGPVFVNADLKPGQIAFTFDDGPHPTRSRRILKILSDNGIRATFFEIGENTEANPAVSKEIASLGHMVGSHTWDHADLPHLALASAEKEILSARSAVMSATGMDIPFFRFPYGASSSALRAFVKGKKLATFFWNMDSLDWKIRDPKALYANVIRELNREKRGIILFHDIHEQTVLVLPYFNQELKRRKFATVVFVPKTVADVRTKANAPK